MPHESVFIRTGLRPLIRNLNARLWEIPETTGVGKLEKALSQLNKLADLHDQIFGPEGDREPDLAGWNRFSRQCHSVIFTLTKDLPELVADNAALNPDVIQMCNELTGPATLKLRLEMRPFEREIVPPRDWELTEEQQQEANDLLEELELRVLRDGVSFPEDKEDEYGSLDLKNEEERNICLTGNRNDLAAFYVKNAGRLTPENKAFLETRIQNSFYLDEVERESREQERLPIFPAEETENGARLDGYQGLYQKQSSDNGCWSCAYAMLLQSRGVRLDQHMVRGFRPAAGVDEFSGADVENVMGVLKDVKFSPYELADLTGKVLPGTALRQQIFVDLDTNDKLEDAYEAARQNIIEALLMHRSPVALRKGNHFVTIVGIEGDRLKVLDSLGSKSRQLEATVSLKKVVGLGEFSLTFLQDLRFDAEGRCTNIPPEFTNAEYLDRKLVSRTDTIDLLNKSGGNFRTICRIGSSTYMSEIYLPSEVPVAQRVLKGPEAGQNEQAQKTEESAAPKDAEPMQKTEEPAPSKDAEPVQKTEKAAASKDAEPTAEVPDTALRQKIQAAIKEDYAQLRQVILDTGSIGEKKTDMTVADPENALRYTLGNLMAHKTILEAYDHTNVPEKDALFEPQVQSARMVESIMGTKTFKRFFENLTMGALADLVDQPPEKQNAAIERAYRAFVNAAEPVRAQTKPNPPENAKNLRKDEPSISTKQKI